jgi:hypothetical protein
MGRSPAVVNPYHLRGMHSTPRWPPAGPARHNLCARQDSKTAADAQRTRCLLPCMTWIHWRLVAPSTSQLHKLLLLLLGCDKDMLLCYAARKARRHLHVGPEGAVETGTTQQQLQQEGRCPHSGTCLRVVQRKNIILSVGGHIEAVNVRSCSEGWLNLELRSSSMLATGAAGHLCFEPHEPQKRLRHLISDSPVAFVYLTCFWGLPCAGACSPPHGKPSPSGAGSLRQPGRMQLPGYAAETA